MANYDWVRLLYRMADELWANETTYETFCDELVVKLSDGTEDFSAKLFHFFGCCRTCCGTASTVNP